MNIVLAFSISILVLAVIILASLRMGKVNGSGLFATTEAWLGWVISIGVTAAIVLFDLAMMFGMYAIFRYVQEYKLKAIAAKPLGYDVQALSGFRHGLEGISIAFGMPVPELTISEASGAAAFSYVLSGRPVVAVTRSGLAAGLTAQEEEALMAHEMAHLSLGSQSVGRGLLDAFIAFAVLFMTMTIWICGTVFVFFSGHPWFIGLGVVVETLVMVPAVVLTLYFGKRLRAIRRHNDLLADSLAARATSNPGALRTALLKLERLGLTGTCDPIVKPGQTGPLTTRTESGVKVTVNIPSWAWPSEKTNIGMGERLMNLEAIERGDWPSFDALLSGRDGARSARRSREGFQTAVLAACVVGLCVLLGIIGYWYASADAHERISSLQRARSQLGRLARQDDPAEVSTADAPQQLTVLVNNGERPSAVLSGRS